MKLKKGDRPGQAIAGESLLHKEQGLIHDINPQGLRNPMGFDGLLMGITSIGRVKTMESNS